MIAADMLDVARSVRIEDELARRGIKLRGRVDRCGPCPRCDGDDRFSINLKKQVFRCRQCGAKGGGSIDLVMFLDGSDFKEAVATLTGFAPERTVCSIAKQRDQVVKQPNKELPNGIGKLALELWHASIDPRGTLVHCYLEHRRLDLPDDAASESIRFHPNCRIGGEHHPAMVCLVRNILTNEPQAIHRTALTPEGLAVKRDGKTFRMSLGPVAGGAIKIDADEHATQGLCIGEGVETCLAGRQMGLRRVWSAVNTGGIARFPVLSGVDGLHIFRDDDANLAGPKDVEACAARWRNAGWDVIITDPLYGSDLNDELRGAA